MKTIQIVLLLTFFISCAHRSGNHNESYSGQRISDFFKEEFSAYDMELRDSVAFIYSFARDFDTSFLLIIRQSNNLVTGNYYYYPPTYYPSFGSWGKSKVFLFKAVNFKLPISSWSRIYKSLNALMGQLRKTPRDYYDVPLHHPQEKIYFGGLLVSNRDYERDFFNSVYVLVNDSLVKGFVSSYPTVNGHVP